MKNAIIAKEELSLFLWHLQFEKNESGLWDSIDLCLKSIVSNSSFAK